MREKIVDMVTKKISISMRTFTIGIGEKLFLNTRTEKLFSTVKVEHCTVTDIVGFKIGKIRLGQQQVPYRSNYYSNKTVL